MSPTERVTEVCKTVSTYWTQGRGYYQLPSSSYNDTLQGAGEHGALGASRVHRLLGRRSRYYSCVASRLTYLALRHSRVVGSVTIAAPNTAALGVRTSLAAAEADSTTRLLAEAP
ncbi:hypothetical protein CVT25_009968 [Psilocybe cyanescens]|uniref:Uncharacterized protein n=1 Tax=Psilocybe cyanescens TaxID=93625 RepID=A0A409XCR3_PSICY|nr:hypothetical protein CVT25_009968 [Psilocybe cyanescens]